MPATPAFTSILNSAGRSKLASSSRPKLVLPESMGCRATGSFTNGCSPSVGHAESDGASKNRYLALSVSAPMLVASLAPLSDTSGSPSTPTSRWSVRPPRTASWTENRRWAGLPPMLSCVYCSPVSSWVTPRPTVVALTAAPARSGEMGSASSAAHAASGNATTRPITRQEPHRAPA